MRSAEPGGPPVPLLRCARCRTARTAIPAPADAHDAGAYRPDAPRLVRVVEPVLALFDRRRLALLARVSPPPGALLDAGAGRGRFVAAAARAGYAARGIEPSARPLVPASAAAGTVERVGIEEAALAPGSLDAVTLWHVLEHLEEPGDALRRIASWLRPGGALLLGVPNLGSFQARLGGASWFHLDAPRHRTHFTVAGLRQLLATAGFDVVGVRHVLLEHNPYGMWQSLVSRGTATPSYLYNLLKRNAPLHARDLAVTALALPLVPVAALVELAAGLARRGGTVAVVARRRA